jgi:hypothetical protein
MPGRPRLPGPRYDCGRRKPQPDDRSNNVWAFVREYAYALGLDERVKTEVGRLSMLKEMTDTQVRAAFLVGRIYGSYERSRRKRRTAASPSYVRSFGDPDGEDDPLQTDALAAYEREVAKAARRYKKLQRCFDALPPVVARRVRALIEDLCVDNTTIGTANLELAAPMLDWIAEQFGLTKLPASQERGGKVAVPLPQAKLVQFTRPPRNQSS